jgi:hypothetical protein
VNLHSFGCVKCTCSSCSKLKLHILKCCVTIVS